MTNKNDGLKEFLNILPLSLKERLEGQSVDDLIEVVMDYGRPAEARFLDRVERMQDLIISREDIDFVVKAVGEFGQDNRAGIERTLHRISCIRNRRGDIIGLTCRVGRALEGTIDIIDDIVRSGQSILLLGKPGVGKTTKLREVARVLADEVSKRVVIVDTSNEIGGDGDVPHPAIGSARRMQVRFPIEQHQVMIEAVENHMPEVIVIDEIGTEQEALAARTIAERGVQLIGTAHGQTLENLMMNPTLCELVGGIQSVTLSDDEARRRGTQKTVLERKAPPTFSVVIELVDYQHLAVHHNVQKTVDALLRGITPRPQIRVITEGGKLEMFNQPEPPELDLTKPEVVLRGDRSAGRPLEPLDQPGKVHVSRESRRRDQFQTRREAEQKVSSSDEVPTHITRIYPYGVARTRLERAIRESRVPAYVCNDIEQADAVLVMRTTYNSRPAKLRNLGSSVQVAIIKSNSYNQIREGLHQILKGPAGSVDYEEEAFQEVLKGIEQVGQTNRYVDLKPQDARTRKVQHKLVVSHQFASENVGVEPNRRVRILPSKI